MENSIEDGSVEMDDVWNPLFNRVKCLKTNLLHLRKLLPSHFNEIGITASHMSIAPLPDIMDGSERNSFHDVDFGSLFDGDHGVSPNSDVESLQLQMTSVLMEKLDSEEGWLILQEKQRTLLDEMASLVIGKDAAESLAVELKLQVESQASQITELSSYIRSLEQQLEEANVNSQKTQEANDGMSVKLDRLRNFNQQLEQTNTELRLELHQKDIVVKNLNLARSKSSDAEQTEREALVSEFAKKEQELLARLSVETEQKDRDYRRKLQARDEEIAQLRKNAEKSALLANVVADLRRELDMKTKAETKHDSERVHVVPRVAVSPTISFSRATSRSQTSLSNIPLYEDEPDCALETTSIPRSISMTSVSRTSISSRCETQPFRYNETTPSRLEELDRRNKAQLPHLKSSYPVESVAHEWRHSQEEEFELGLHEEEEPQTESGTASLLQHQRSDSVKKNFFQKLQSTLKTSKSSKKDSRGGKENNPGDFAKPSIPTAKPVAFVVDVTPEKKKKKKTKKA